MGTSASRPGLTTGQAMGASQPMMGMVLVVSVRF